jgi:formylglycine-generating enzyme required for sulfatase activity
MTSVVCSRHLMQWSLDCFVVLTLVATLGCQPCPSDKKPAPKNQPAQSGGHEAPAPAARDQAKPASELPGVEAPVQKMPNREPVKQPAKNPSAETSPRLVPAAAKVGKQAAPAGADPTMDVPSRWLPKPVDNPAAEAKDQAGMKPYTEKVLNTDAKFDMVPIPGGTFKMGSPASEKDRKDDEGPQVEVQLEPFWMGKHEVTWDEYELWGLGLDQQRRQARNTAANKWDTTADAVAMPTKPYSDMTFGMGKEGYPAVCMTQFAAKMYCKWLSAKTGRYYRLPTEAEWEYACRAGQTTPYSFGANAEKLGDYGWFEGNSEEKYHKVGLKKPNPWGLYDMHGNVSEWCLDQYIPDRYKQLGGKLVLSPLVSVTTEYPQVVRGGAWTDEAPLLRSAARRGSSKEWKAQDPQIPQSIWYHTDADFVGFRVVRPLRTPTPEEAARYDITEYEKQELIDYKKAQAGKQ